MGYKAGVAFPPSFVLYLTVFHTSLVLAKVSAKLLSQANRNDLLYADTSTNSPTKSFNIVCECFLYFHRYFANHLLKQSVRAGVLRFQFEWM